MIFPAELNGMLAWGQTDSGCVHVIAAKAEASPRREVFFLCEPDDRPFDGQGDGNIVCAAVVRRILVKHVKRPAFNNKLDLIFTASWIVLGSVKQVTEGLVLVIAGPGQAAAV